MNEKTLYFAYGSNLNLDQMARRCPDAEPVGRVRLDGYRLAFRRTGGGYLTFCPTRATMWTACCGKSAHRTSKRSTITKAFRIFMPGARSMCKAKAWAIRQWCTS